MTLKTKFLFSLFFVVAFCQPVRANALATVLLFNGTGSSPTDVVALENILTAMGLTYATANSAQMNAMSKATIGSYKMIVWPGGNSIDMGNSLTASATALVRNAVVQTGVSYIGFCAGAFMAESSTEYNVFNLAGTWFDFYQANVTNMVWTTFANGFQRDLVYWDGPEIDGFGSVIAKYPNGQSAIAEAWVGKGFVVLSGVHPEAPADWRVGFASPDVDGVAADVAFATTLLNAAISKTLLAHF
jgi:glutamine amidotransferase-like uncharacterized protein